ncbi:MAG TPA: cytochrome c biogenesis protein CcsA [Anaerolineae bacterium]|nr:cytochrome c biogenesis protein CcsA [Anaerolineae bacterium]HQI86784.1 cytochrome c biogenesis protein CcsA [Anaerolineae bacterium]
MAKKSLLNSVLAGLSVVMFLVALGMVFFYAPREATMGEVQRIFYFHVATAWVGFFGFFITFLGGAVYLATNNRRWDILAFSSAEIGLVFITMTLVTGMLWAKPAWGTYWTWEPRLTISAVQWLLYVAYIMLRGSVLSPEREARFAAVYGIAAFVTVPLSWFAIRWWRTIHPQIVSSEGMALTAKMIYTLLFSLATFTLVYVTLLRQRIQLEKTRDQLAALRLQHDQAAQND